MKLRVLLVGQESAGAQILRKLTAEHEVVAVLTQAPGVLGGPASLSALADGLGVRTLPASLVSRAAFADRVRDWRVDVLLNVHSLHIIADEVLAAPRVGSFNLHPGPLPEYAGLNTVGWAIYNGAPEYGVTVHWMAPHVDAGPVAFRERFSMPTDATALSLSTDCTRRGLRLLERLLECAADDPGSLPAEDQDLSRRRYYTRADVPQGGRVEWDRPARAVLRLGRAFDCGPFACPWGRPYTRTGAGRFELVGLVRTAVACDEPPGTPRLDRDGVLWMACTDEWVGVRRLYDANVRVDPSALLATAR